METWHSLEESSSMENQWLSYKVVNEIFAEHVFKHYQEKDSIVWLHDYHLMLLPQMLKAKCPNMKVGWFLHTPFPSSEIYRTLFVREEILKAVLAADLIGFHTYDYARHFSSCCSRVLGLEGTSQGIEHHGHITRVIACPIGITIENFTNALKEATVQKYVNDFKENFAGRKVIFFFFIIN